MASLRRSIASHRVAALVIAVLVLAGVGVALFWFEPQKLFIDERVDEEVPGNVARVREGDDDPAGSEPSPKPTVKMLASGTFTALNHDARGEASVLEVDGVRFLRFEEFEVENGPDLKVYISNASKTDDPSTFDEDFVDLGDLKGNIGNQNYRIPDGVDLTKYRSAVVWCRRFSVGFAVADVGI
jgi:hypothetical protein